MSKIIHLVVNKCGECPYGVYISCADQYCSHKLADVEEIIDWKTIHEKCPLQTY